MWIKISSYNLILFGYKNKCNKIPQKKKYITFFPVCNPSFSQRKKESSESILKMNGISIKKG